MHLHRTAVVFLLSVSFFAGASFAASAPKIRRDAKFFVEPGEFGTYIVSAIQKKGVPVRLVSEKDAADYIISATAESEKAGWARTLALGQTGSNENASINVIDAKTKEIIWGYNVHKRNSVHGKQSSAEACAKHLKEIIGE